MRRVMTSLAALAAMLVATFGIPSVATATTGPTQLILPANLQFAYLGHWCGGIGMQTFATGFDPTTGYPTGDVFLTTTCSSGGRGSHPDTFTAWVSASWYYTGSIVSSSLLTTTPTVDPALTAYDAYGNEVYNTSNNAFVQLAPTFNPAPIVTGISTTVGPASGGTSITISGYGLTGATAVAFGGAAAASFTVNGDTSVTAVSPSTSAGTVDVTVTTAGGVSATSSADQFTFVPQPTVTGLSPSSGPLTGRTPVTITGSGFTAATTVSFGGIPALFTVVDDSTIDAIAPVGEAVDSVAVTVSSIGGTSPSTPADVYNYTPPVVCTKVSGIVGVSLTIARCTPHQKTNLTATLDPTGTFFTWAPSKQTTTVSLNAPYSPGRGSCPLGHVEWYYSGTVTGGTSSYTTNGDVFGAVTCASKTGTLALATGYTVSF
jgi:large repetitive protein